MASVQLNGAAIVDGVAAACPRTERLASLCSGAFFLAAAGVLDGKRATTHWSVAERLQAAHPAIAVEADAIFIRDGKLWTSAGVTAMDPGYLDVARTMGASGWERLTRVVIPAVRPAILGGIRLALGTAWIVLVPAEMLGVRSGLGYQILNGRDQLAYDQVMAVILVIGILGFALDGLSRLLLRDRAAR